MIVFCPIPKLVIFEVLQYASFLPKLESREKWLVHLWKGTGQQSMLELIKQHISIDLQNEYPDSFSQKAKQSYLYELQGMITEKLVVSKFNLQKGDLIRQGQVLFLLFLQISLLIHFLIYGSDQPLKKNGQSTPLIRINKQSNQQKQQQ